MVIFGIGDDFYPIHSSNFSGGELHVQAPALQSLRFRSYPNEAVRVMARLQNPRDVMYKMLDNFIMQTRPVIVAPDAGAAKKAMAVAKQYNLPFIAAEKVRNASTGEITATKIDAPQVINNFLICDDICDGGRTFTELAKVLRNGRANVHIALYVTHGIFSKGYAVFDGLIDKIFTTDTFLPEIPKHEHLAEVLVGKVTPSPMWVRQ